MKKSEGKNSPDQENQPASSENEGGFSLQAYCRELAHDLGSPLNVIMGRAELAMRRIKSDDLIYQDLKIIMQQVERIREILQSSIDSAEIKAK